jgi:hypothetical protein
MLIWLSAALLVLALGLTLRWARTRYDALGRPTGFPTISVGLCLVIGLGSIVPVRLHARTEHRLSAAASAIGDIHASVHCQTLGEASIDLGPELGYVKFDAAGVPEKHALIKWQQCHQLAKWLGSRSDREHPSRDEMVAVHVLTHETMHMVGSTDEAITECRAMQRDAAMARQLGDDPSEADALAVRYWQEIYPRMADNYRSSNCTRGGSLDEHLPDAPWS